MSNDQKIVQEIEQAAGTEDEQGIIQPSVEEILDADPEHGENASDEEEAMDDAQAEAAEEREDEGGYQ